MAYIDERGDPILYRHDTGVTGREPCAIKLAVLQYKTLNTKQPALLSEQLPVEDCVTVRVLEATYRYGLERSSTSTICRPCRFHF